MSPYEFLAPFRRFFRRRRFRAFASGYADCRTILDVGGDHTIWTECINRRKGVLLLNLTIPGDCGGFPYICGDGRRLPFADKSFDLAFSNSAIEHVGNFEDQRRFAAEMMRVGKRIYCQTPSRLFPIDPHLAAPFLHWLPKAWLKPKLLRYLTLNGWLWGREYQYDVAWLSKRKLRQLFPGGQIVTEYFLGLPKSYTVVR